MNKDDVLKIIDGRTYYYTDYVYYLYNELKKRDEIIKEVRERIENATINCDGQAEDLIDDILEILDKENKEN